MNKSLLKCKNNSDCFSLLADGVVHEHARRVNVGLLEVLSLIQRGDAFVVNLREQREAVAFIVVNAWKREKIKNQRSLNG